MTKLASNPSALQSPTLENEEPLSLIGLDRVDLAKVIEPLGVKPFRAQQIFRWIYNHGVSDFSQMTNISKNLQIELAKHGPITPFHHLLALGCELLPVGGRQTHCGNAAPCGGLGVVFGWHGWVGANG